MLVVFQGIVLPSGVALWALSVRSRAQPQDERDMQDGVLEVPDGPLIEQVLIELGIIIFLEL